MIHFFCAVICPVNQASQLCLGKLRQPAPSRASYGGDEAYGEPRFSVAASQRRTTVAE